MQPLKIHLGIQIHVVKQVGHGGISACKCMLPKSCSDLVNLPMVSMHLHTLVLVPIHMYT